MTPVQASSNSLDGTFKWIEEIFRLMQNKIWIKYIKFNCILSLIKKKVWWNFISFFRREQPGPGGKDGG